MLFRSESRVLGAPKNQSEPKRKEVRPSIRPQKVTRHYRTGQLSGPSQTQNPFTPSDYFWEAPPLEIPGGNTHPQTQNSFTRHIFWKSVWGGTKFTSTVRCQSRFRRRQVTICAINLSRKKRTHHVFEQKKRTVPRKTKHAIFINIPF